ncbi:hypothetical protein ACFQAS_07810 [Halopenitus salinus]|uniref:DNA primase n=1 Tax=Halopenitus salinus TaxID=1198295 RepID=A0ABD5UZL1_9EURY
MSETTGTKTIGLLLIAVVAIGAMAGVAAAEGDFGVTVDDAGNEPTVTVTENDSAVENATVNVTTAEGQNVTYAGEGEYTTDENGTVGLPAAEENVTVEVTATAGNESVSTTVDLTAGDDDESAEDTPFGQLVREFIQQTDDRDGGIGSAVSEFVTSNNPGNADDAPGNAGDAPGNSDRANDGERGPPAHAGPGDDADDESDDVDDDDDAEEEEDETDTDDADEESDDADDGDVDEDDADDEDESEEDESEDDDADEENESEEADADDADDEADADDADDEADEEDEDDTDDESEEDDDDGERGPPDHAGGPGGN